MGMLLVRAEAMREGAQVLAFLIPKINASLAVAVFGRDSLNNARSKPIRAIIVRTFRRRANIGSAHIGHEVAKIIDKRMYMLPRGYAAVIARKQIATHLAEHSHTRRIRGENVCILKLQVLAILKP